MNRVMKVIESVVIAQLIKNKTILEKKQFRLVLKRLLLMSSLSKRGMYPRYHSVVY